MRRIIALLTALSLLAGMAAAASLGAEAEGLPTSVTLSWNPVEGAAHYDIYNGDKPVARLGSDASSYTVEKLLSDEEYTFCVAARGEGNEDIDAEWVSVSTSSWDGVYEWINETDKDNKGRMKSLRFRLDTKVDPVYGQYHEMFLLSDDGNEYRIFPLFPFDSDMSGQWIDYDDQTPAGIAYRINAERFNKSSFTPSRWRVDRIEIDSDSTSAYIQTSAFGITVMTTTTYNLYMEDGQAMMTFETNGSGIADTVIFRNPNPGEGDAFILRRIQQEG